MPLGVDTCKFVPTPGVKRPEEAEFDPPEPAFDAHEENYLGAYAIVNPEHRVPTERIVQRDIDGATIKIVQKLCFDLSKNITYEIKPYSEQYVVHPRSLVFIGPCTFGGLPQHKLVSDKACPFTGKVQRIVSRRKRNVVFDSKTREAILNSVLMDGPGWEPNTGDLVDSLSALPVCNAATPKKKPKAKSKFQQKRLGTKRVKDLERLHAKGDKLLGEDATLYRALAARANYLALDRPDLGFSTKELCREFSQPTALSVEKLKRLVRFIVHHGRLVWQFNVQDNEGEINTVHVGGDGATRDWKFQNAKVNCPTRSVQYFTNKNCSINFRQSGGVIAYPEGRRVPVVGRLGVFFGCNEHPGSRGC